MSDLPFAAMPPRRPAPEGAPAAAPRSAEPQITVNAPPPRVAQTGPKTEAIPTFGATTAPPSPAFGRMTIDEILTHAVKNGASDIHFAVNDRVRARIDGELSVMPHFPEEVTSEWLNATLKAVLNEELWERYNKDLEADLSYEVPGVARFRVNCFFQRALPGAVFRVIPTVIKTIEELGVPHSLREISKKPKGLILVTGPTGSGKSTTLTAMIDAINDTRAEHIMTIEDPIEFVHKSKKSLVNQREVGGDTKSFAEALKRVLRQDPDVILVGELRDPETISIALTAAETGHLVFGTLHTQSATKTIDRIVDSFSGDQQSQIKAQLSDTLQAVIAQTLVKKVGGGRVVATEIMIRTPAIANMIREGQIPQLYSSIQTGSSYGMHTLDQDLQRLVSLNLVAKDVARPLMTDPESLNNVSSAVKSEGESYDDWTMNG